MSTPPEDGETPMQRALRLKKAAQEARPKGPAEKLRREQTGMPSGASKPWLKR